MIETKIHINKHIKNIVMKKTIIPQKVTLKLTL